MKIGRIIHKYNGWKWYYRFKKPSKIVECRSDEEQNKTLKEYKKNGYKQIAKAFSSWQEFFYIDVLKKDEEIIYIFHEMGG